MDQSGCLRSHRSPKACRNRVSRKTAEPAPRFPRSVDEDEDWETDPDYINNASRPHGEQAVSTASIISDLSRSIRDCSLRRSVSHKKESDRHQSHLRSYKDSTRIPAKDPEGHRAPLCPQVCSSPSLGIERSSVFNRNAAETLDTFFSKKLKAWAGEEAQLSDSYENMEAPQVPASPSQSRRRPETARVGPERTSRRQNPSRPGPARGVVVDWPCSSWGHYEPSTYYGQGRQDGRRPSSSVSSSARILPQCRISHVQSCGACQAFNRELPAEKEAFYEDHWPPWHGEDGDRGPGRNRRGASSQQRLAKVQQWLEQTPVDEPLKAERDLASPPGPGRGGASSSRQPKEGPPWGRAGDAGAPCSGENRAEPRHRRKPHKARSPGRQPVARIVPCNDTSPSPAECSCLFCERQKARAKRTPAKREGQKGTDPSAQEVAVQLQAEDRVPRIVEAFERRSLREAKRAERDRPLQPSRHKDSEKRARAAKGRGDGKQGHPPQGGPKARKSRSKEEPEGAPRPAAGPEGDLEHSQGKGQPVGRRPSFLDRLRGLY
ncbi:uncharacterized protein LOC143845253 [Paroedura picta]|uniref:uncharacterized protein LOC143845253 n=1 Tax=Paroedura picta TaxID=143630 RepID=UPI0040579B82